MYWRGKKKHFKWGLGRKRSETRGGRRETTSNTFAWLLLSYCIVCPIFRSIHQGNSKSFRNLFDLILHRPMPLGRPGLVVRVCFWRWTKLIVSFFRVSVYERASIVWHKDTQHEFHKGFVWNRRRKWKLKKSREDWHDTKEVKHRKPCQLWPTWWTMWSFIWIIYRTKSWCGKVDHQGEEPEQWDQKLSAQRGWETIGKKYLNRKMKEKCS